MKKKQPKQTTKNERRLSIVQTCDERGCVNPTLTWDVVDGFNMDVPTRRLFDICVAQKSYELTLTRNAIGVCRFTADELIRAGFGSDHYIAMVHFWDGARALMALKWEYRKGSRVPFVGVYNHYGDLRCEINLNPSINWKTILTTKPL